ncbi:MAG TPA: hypothetical protein VFI42_15375 [Thermomicrobiaceae bacterium]|nr:hypothetical protein [Thermomicrobiaceae bacterium]
MYDLVIKGGTLVDARNNLIARRDLAIEGGKIARLAPEIAAEEAREAYDAAGKLVMPGIIDTEVHIPVRGGGTTAHRQLARAGVTTALDFSDFRGMLAELPIAGAGITVGGIQMLGPYAGETPSSAALDDQIQQVLHEGALGIKVLGGHYPSTPEATALMIARGNAAGAFVGYHCGTTTAPSTLAGLRQAPDLIGHNSLQIAHINAYLRGADADIVAENEEALAILRTIPWVVTESHLFPFNGCSGECADDVPRDQITRNCLRLRGYTETRDGMRQAFLDGYCHANVRSGEGLTQISGEEGLRLWEEANTRQGVSFPVNSRISALMTATARLTPRGVAFEGDGDFIVDTLTSDGGRWRNVILEKGLDLVDFGFMTLRQFVHKASDLPARVLALPEKGHLGEGADADVIVADQGRRQVSLTVANGAVVQLDGVVVGSGATVLTSQAGVKHLSELGLPTRVVDVTQGYLYHKGRADSEQGKR